MVLILATATYAQNFPFPTSSNYSAPLTAYTGRIVDSTTTEDFYDPPRPYRGYGSGVSPATGHVYYMLGEVFVEYPLSTFATDLANPAKYLTARSGQYRSFASSVNPPSQNWDIATFDSQRRLYGFAVDDRNYIYLAYDAWGFGIVTDGSAGFQRVFQAGPVTLGGGSSTFYPRRVQVFHLGSNYYALIGNGTTDQVWDVTTPSSARKLFDLSGGLQDVQVFSYGGTMFVAWLSYSDVDTSYTPLKYKLKIARATDVTSNNLTSGTVTTLAAYDSLATDGTYLFACRGTATSPLTIATITPQSATAVPPSVTTTSRSFGSTSFICGGITGGAHLNDGYLATWGGTALGPLATIFQVTGGVPTLFFSTTDQRTFYTTSNSKLQTLCDVFIFKNDGKTYMVYSLFGLTDVYLLGGIGVGIDPSGSYGTTNPNSNTSANRPFYGDPIPLKSTFSGTPAPNITWDFGNPEAGSANTATTSANATLSYQYAGIGSISSTTMNKTVTVTNTTNLSDTGSATVTMNRPAARVVLGGTSFASPGSSTSPKPVPGDSWYDGSDGSIESHYDVWGPDPNDPNSPTATSKPGTGFDVGSCGAHTLAFQPHYIPYDPNTITPVISDPTKHYKPSFSALGYEVRPFWAGVAVATSDSTTITFKNAARIGSSSIFASGTTTPVTIDWSLMNGATSVASTSHATTIGAAALDTWQIPKSSIVDGDQVVVTMTVAAGASSVAACDTAAYQTSTAQMTLTIPDPKITMSGCANVGSPCSFTGSSTSGKDTSGWSWLWSISGASSTTNPYSPSLSTAGTYMVQLTASNAIGSQSTSMQFTVNPPLCATGLGTASSLSMGGSCTTGCPVGSSITFTAYDSFSTYKFQSCDNFSWDFGDGSTGGGTGTSYASVSHSYSSSGTRTVRLTISNSTGQSRSLSTTVSVGTTSSCSSGLGSALISVGPSCSSGCSAGSSITFQAYSFGSYVFQSCDTFSWNFGDGHTTTGTGTGGASTTHSFSTDGTYTVTLTVHNTTGQSKSATTTVSVGSGSCVLPQVSKIIPGTDCPTSGCEVNTSVTFSLDSSSFGYTPQSCDTFLWTFGDGGSSTQQSPTHTYAAGGSYSATVKVTSGTAGSVSKPFTVTVIDSTTAKPTGIDFTYTPASPIAGITVVNFSGTQSGGDPATTWKWSFGDGSGTATGKNVTHTFANPQTYTVTLTASNGGGSNSAAKQVIAVEDFGYSFMIPAVIHAPGANGSVWRSDFQAYVPNVSSTNPLTLNLEFNGCVYTTPSACTPTQVKKTMVVNSSTFVVEDFMASAIDPRGGSGSVIVSGNSPDLPQMWTRTYNLAPGGGGTYGQLVPAVLLSSQQNALLDAPELNIGGLQQSTRFRTNLGFVNPNGTAITLTAHVFDDTGFEFGAPFTINLNPYQLDQRPITSWCPSMPATVTKFSVRIDNTNGLPVIGYASQVDNKSNDPVYIPALSDDELSTESSRDLVIPSVGHFNSWRSDITIFNPDSKTNSYDVGYYDSTGVLRATLPGVTIAGKGMLGITDVLKSGQLLPVVSQDSIGEIVVHTNLNPTVFPQVFGRTYSDQGTAGTFGYASPAFQLSKPNVVSGRPAYVPGVRNDSDYYTNLGLISLNATNTTKVSISLLDPSSGATIALRQFDLGPFQSTIISQVLQNFLFNSATKGTLKIEIVSGGPIWAYGTVIDRTTADPEYVPAVPAN